MGVAHRLSRDDSRIDDELESLSTYVQSLERNGLLTKLLVPQTFALASTTLLVALVPILVEPHQ